MPLEKARRPSLNPFLLLRGPVRPYVFTDNQETNSWLNFSLAERIHLTILFILALSTRLYRIGNPSYPVVDEFLSVQKVNNYIKGEFFLDYNPPFINLFYTLIAKLFGYGLKNFDIVNIGAEYITFPYYPLRIVSSFLGACSVILAYKTLRSTGVSHFISLFGSYLLSIENSMITQGRFIFKDGIYVFFIALFISSHKAEEVKKRFSFNWFIHVIISAVFLGLLMSSHWSGIFFVIYSFASHLLELWTLIGDVHITFKYALNNFIMKTSIYIVVTLTIYLSLFNLHFNYLDKVGEDYDSLSPYFQASLKDSHLENTFSNINFGSNIMIRNYKTGNYLHSHEDFFHSSSRQQVTMINTYDDYNNLFKITQLKGDLDNDTPVIPPFRVRIYHDRTDSSLVVDSANKPPLSEQEYNSLLTTDTNFNHNDENVKRYSFQLKMATNYCKNEAAKNALRTVDSVFQIYNEENSCYLLATPLHLHEGFSEGQKEVICIKEPNYEASLWFIDWNDNINYTDNKKRLVLNKLSFWEKLYEVHCKMFKKLYIGNPGYDEPSSNSNVFDFMFLKKGFIQWVTSDLVIYLLGNFIIYYLIAIAIIIYTAFKIFQISTFNPFQHSTSLDSPTYKYDRKTMDYLLLYALVIIPLTFVKIETHLFNYLPGVFIGVLLISQSFQWSFEKLTTLTYILVGVFTILATLAFVKFTPIIYGLTWTQEQCLKMMASPNWDRTICDSYSV